MSGTRTTCVAVIDIGKTNKKVHVYDDALDLVDSRSKTFDSIERDGVPWVPSEAVEEWLLDTLSQLGSRYAIGLISIATHGATIACVGEDGDLAIPIVDYTHEPGDSFHEAFYERCGSPDDLQRETATPKFPALLNAAKALFFFRRSMPEAWERVRHVLFYPQFLAYRLTARIGADFTYAGCHTYLFDFERMDYSSVADALDVRGLLPESIHDPGTVLGRLDPAVAGRTGLSPETKVTLGVHDSNSSLLPYLIKRPEEDFIVNSTGTWCVAMHPEERVAFGEDEIGKAVFYNMSALRQPVKTSILMGGQEFDMYTSVLQQRFGMEGFPDFDLRVYQSVVADAEEFILPAIVRGTGQFPDSEARIVDQGEVFAFESVREGSAAPELFSNTRRAFAVLNLSLAIQTITALERVGLAKDVTVYTEGGFRNNRDYNALLATLAPGAAFRLSGMPEATSFGAALLGWAALESTRPVDLADRFELDVETVSAVEIPGLEAYVAAFHRHLAEGA